MATAGLSLLGFLEKQQALSHLRTACIAPDISDAALETVWIEAAARLGPSVVKAGKPEILPFPAEAAAHVAEMALGWPQPPNQPPPEFRMIEIAPLLAYQIIIDGPRSGFHCKRFSNPPTLAELLAVCLPTRPLEEPLQSQELAQSLIIKARSLNVRLQAKA